MYRAETYDVLISMLRNREDMLRRMEIAARLRAGTPEVYTQVVAQYAVASLRLSERIVALELLREKLLRHAPARPYYPRAA